VFRLNIGMKKKPRIDKFRLTNKRTGKLASASTWLKDLAACAVLKGDNHGIPTLLPLSDAAKLLIHNELKKFTPHEETSPKPGIESSHSQIRALACLAMPEIADFYLKNAVGDHSSTQINEKGFRHWIIGELANPPSSLNKFLRTHPRFSVLVELNRKDNWWLDRQKRRVNP
jgi:hypothetical protein